MNITSQDQLNVILNDIIHDVAVAVANRLYDLNRAEIEEIVYGAGNPKVYERSPDGQGFVDAWETKDNHSLNTHTAELNYAPERMMVDEDNFVHGSPSSGDIRSALAEIIYGGLSGARFGDGYWRQPRDAFKAIIKRCNQSLDGWIVDEFVKRGFSRSQIKYIKGGRAWGVSLDGTD